MSRPTLFSTIKQTNSRLVEKNKELLDEAQVLKEELARIKRATVDFEYGVQVRGRQVQHQTLALGGLRTESKEATYGSGR